MKISFVEPELPHSGAVVAGIWETNHLTPFAARLDERSRGAIRRALAAAPRFAGKKAELLPILAPAELPVSRLVLCGLGKPEAADARLYEEVGGALVPHLNSVGETAAMVAIDLAGTEPIGEAEAAARIALGASLRDYRFDRYKTKQKPEQQASLGHLAVATAAKAAAARAFEPLEEDGGGGVLHTQSRV